MEIKRNVYRQRVYDFKIRTGRKPTGQEKELLKKYNVSTLLNIEKFLKEDLKNIYENFKNI